VCVCVRARASVATAETLVAKQGEYDKAVAMHEQALKMRQEVHPPPLPKHLHANTRMAPKPQTHAWSLNSWSVSLLQALSWNMHALASARAHRC
jgi:hypothetical protein